METRPRSTFTTAWLIFKCFLRNLSKTSGIITMASFYENDTSEYFQSGHLDGARIDLRFDISVYRNESCNKTEYVFGRTEGILAGVFASLLSISGITANIITISALLNFQKTRNHVTTLFIVSLATSDLVFSMFTLPTLSTRFFTG